MSCLCDWLGWVILFSRSPSAPILTSQCLSENTCAAFNFPDSVEGGDTNPCTNGIQLKTTSGTTTCNVKCKAGYTGSTTSVTCASDAVEGASADSTVSCSGEATPHHTLLSHHSDCFQRWMHSLCLIPLSSPSHTPLSSPSLTCSS